MKHDTSKPIFLDRRGLVEFAKKYETTGRIIILYFICYWGYPGIRYVLSHEGDCDRCVLGSFLFTFSPCTVGFDEF